MTGSALALGLLIPALAAAADRPDESELFGGSPPPAPPAAATEAPPAPTSPPPRDARELEGERGAEGRLLGVLDRTDNPLQIGGTLYLRSALSARQGTPPADWAFTAPSLTDVYLDARPTERVRGFVLGRMLFDPLQGSTATAIPGLDLAGGAAAPANPRVLLDQLWIAFDAGQRVFFTVGRQHVKWGVGRLWNPTDFLHTVRRDPLATFDERTGTFLVRAQVPWEARGWNFQAVAILEPLLTQATPVSSALTGGAAGPTGGTAASGAGDTLSGVGGGARAELLLDGFELGLDAVAQRGVRTRLGADVSGGIWELDVKAELALRDGADLPLYRGALFDVAGNPGFTATTPGGLRPQVVVGAEWSHKYTDEDTFTVGVEYFHQTDGYSDASLYPVLLATNAFTPFYLGKDYAGAYVLLPKPGSWDLHSFTLSAIANLSDRTGVARLDWSMTLLTYLTLEAYAQAHVGRAGGEFRLAFDLPANLFGSGSPPVTLKPQIADVGLALRMKL